MKKKLIGMLICVGIVGTVGFIHFFEKGLTEDDVITDLNEVVKHYQDLNTDNDDSFALRVDDTIKLLITYAPSYSLLGVSNNEYTTRPIKPNEVFKQEKDLYSSICSFDNALIYNSEAQKYYNVRFKSSGKPIIPIFTEAKELE